jgi:hypothetical protein
MVWLVQVLVMLQMETVLAAAGHVTAQQQLQELEEMDHLG